VFFIQIYVRSKFLPLLGIVSLPVPARYIRALSCSMSAPQIRIIPLLDALQLLMLFAGTLKCLEPKLFLIFFYNRSAFRIKILIVRNMSVCIYTFSCRIMAVAVEPFNF
jgi:hypothetical protein